ncbi:2,3-diketo-5-methylthiopentyl-1-phosphate enolase [Ferroacidibacillus organovorans]|uniref:2,3-diketo-5-methylthiopentyl-1-phosphate enolase n=1 Tax=Ferroacidibacillus organovorans TaxID=1765683 RepID=A0A853KGI3_9BACL|nr:2,3-diketo-5-methylthiopentyl-1-phosphate enolase [Ferroacidibacillus organovorans]KYP80928.1 2,3-diketo-5-methylthiopentyl-1-phosphate enolase [Ferroacidibacillus organovorans]OAG95464.1 2,3-diketo-5-methylthiopentyl-1-phosphate enolase [Ferroacidibacillus organovorans]
MEQQNDVIARYALIDREKNLSARAEGIAVGLTVGSWTDLPRATQERVEPFRGRIEEIRTLDVIDENRVRAEIAIRYPMINLTDQIAALLTTVFGKLSMDGEIRLVDLTLPSAYQAKFQGAKFGVRGLRERLSVYDRPLVMSIFKTCVGQTLDELAFHFREQAQGGVDLIKDDEIFFHEAVPPQVRVKRYREEGLRLEQETGRRPRYAVNLTGPVFQLKERAKRLQEVGADLFLFNVFAYGLDVLRELTSDSDIQVPFMAHPALAGAFYASAHHGIAAHVLLGDLLRLAGADIAIFPSPFGSVRLAREESALLTERLRAPGPFAPLMPAPSAGIHPGMVPLLVAEYGEDVIVNAGGGIHGHPRGAAAGGKAIYQALDAVRSGVPLNVAAETHMELYEALVKWGAARV